MEVLCGNRPEIGEIYDTQVVDYKLVDSLAGGVEFELSIEVLQAFECKRFRVETILCSGAFKRFRYRLYTVASAGFLK